MMRNSFCKMQYLLLAMLMLALTACGTTQTAGTDAGNSLATAKIAANVVLPKSAAKSVALTSASVTKVRLKVTGASIPTATKDFAGSTGGTIEVYPGSDLIVTALALDSSSAVLFEGFATAVTVVAGTPTNVTIQLVPPVVKPETAPCLACHDNTRDVTGQNLVANYKQSGHYFNNISTGKLSYYGANYAGCAGCHGTQHNDLNPSASGRCYDCHGTSGINSKHVAGGTALQTACVTCHQPHNTKLSCIGCHDIAQNAVVPFGITAVNDNSGVRAILPEFNKRSHHITGAAPTDAQCAVCHLEGKVVGGAVTVDSSKHMADASIHLRNADTNTDFVWSGTEHTAMDNFCFSCHDSDGAIGLDTAGLNAITGGTAKNPFGDTLTNGYDQVARAGVVDVKTPFTTTNASHHAVSGQRYTYRFSTLANATAWAARTGKPVPAASEIAEGHVVAGVTSPFGTGLTYDPAGAEEGGEATLYEGGKFVSTYIPLGASLNVADNSTIHCGDCHTVGQWKAGSSTNADGSTTAVTIGAHGSANEYLLRNSLGTDALHNGLTYVCFNCHAASQEVYTNALWAELVAENHINPSTAVTGTYLNCADFGGYAAGSTTACVSGAGKVVPVIKVAKAQPANTVAGFGQLHPTVIPGQLHGYYVAHAVSAFHAQCQADSADNIGATDRQSKSWSPQAVKAYDYLPAPGATAAAPAAGSNAGSGNITGIACTNCHNSGLRNGFGGIHGGNSTYTDGLGRTQTTYRFMPGMGNYRYAPPGGWDGKDVSNPKLVTVNNPLQESGAANGSGSLGFPGPSGKPVGGCYTNGAADLNPGYSTCSHHGTSTVAVYGGGTTSSNSTYEPTVREATAGGTLVTRPLKY